MVTLDGIDGEPVPNANRVRSIVTDIAFLGSVVRVSVDIGDGTIVHVDTFNNPNLAVPPAGVAGDAVVPARGLSRAQDRDVSQEIDALAAAEAML